MDAWTFTLAPLALLAAAVAAPLAVRRAGRAAGWLLAAGPVATLLLLAAQLPAVQAGHYPVWSAPWFGRLGVDAALRLDGLALLLGLLVALVTAVVVPYAAAYFEGEPRLGRFFAILLGFAAAMMGLVLADNAVLLFVCWELTTVTSYLLVGFDHRDAKARKSALQAILVTGAGGLALLGGLLLLGQMAGTLSLSGLVAQGTALQAHPWFPAAAALVLLGCLTKSAQFPFHFWLPNAMAAPSPVSALLHSATMVKAGVFLAARLTPVFDNFPLWQWTLTVAGGLTMVLGAANGLLQTDLKKMLAHTTVSVLGMLTLLLGLGSELAVQSMLLLLVGHALYKATLFLTVGSLDHATGTREVRRLRGLLPLMPWTGAAALLASFSMAGFPPFFGFLGKEFFYKTGTQLDDLAPYIVVAAVGTNILLLAQALKAGLHPYFGRRTADARGAHEGPAALWAGPLLLAVLGLLAGLFSQATADWLVAPAVSAVAGERLQLKAALWQGINLPLLLSGVTVGSGILLYRLRGILWTARERWQRPAPWADAAYGWLLGRTLDGAAGLTRRLQNGSLPHYGRTLAGAALALLGAALAAQTGGAWAVAAGWPELFPAGLAVGMGLAAVVAATAARALTALLALGVVGYGLALLFAYYGAPDLALTQLCVESLALALILFVLRRLPPPAEPSSAGVRWGDAALAGGFGAAVVAALWLAQGTQLGPPIAPTLAEWSYPEAHGRNVVNVILVDFRALDTFGEITVVALAALALAGLAGPPPRGQPAAPSLGGLVAVAAERLWPVLLALSLLVLYRGHNLPGGGFIGGLVAAGGVLLLTLAAGPGRARAALRLRPAALLGAGLATALLSAVLGLAAGGGFMEGLWLPAFELPLLGAVKLGTPVLFDVGVYLAVVGFAAAAILALAETEPATREAPR